jgi:hypothetical protein
MRFVLGSVLREWDASCCSGMVRMAIVVVLGLDRDAADPGREAHGDRRVEAPFR